MLLYDGATDTKYTIEKIVCDDKDTENFLLTLGCYAGEEIIILSKLKDNFIVKIKDARYSIDNKLLEAIHI